MEYIAAVSFGCTAYREVGSFLCDYFDFSETHRDDISLTVNNGVLSLRLLSGDQEKISLYLDMECDNYLDGIERLKSLSFHPISDHRNPTPFRVEQDFEGPFGIRVNVYQNLTVDDLGLLPEVHPNLDWQEDALLMAQQLLKHVSIHFREIARKKMVEQAESFALIEGTMEVSVEDMVTAFLHTTPYFKQDHLQQLLRENGISQEFIDQKLAQV